MLVQGIVHAQRPRLGFNHARQARSLRWRPTEHLPIILLFFNFGFKLDGHPAVLIEDTLLSVIGRMGLANLLTVEVRGVDGLCRFVVSVFVGLVNLQGIDCRWVLPQNLFLV